MYINGSAQAIMVLGVCATVAISVVSIGKAYVRSIEAGERPPQSSGRGLGSDGSNGAGGHHGR